jgi:hypothetical protein
VILSFYGLKAYRNEMLHLFIRIVNKEKLKIGQNIIK